MFEKKFVLKATKGDFFRKIKATTTCTTILL